MTDPIAVVDGTDPYPWPWDGRFAIERVALVVCGVQRAYADVSLDVRVALAHIDELSTVLRRAGAVICHVRHTSPRDRVRPLLPRIGHDGWAPVVRPGPEDLLVEAGGHDGFCASSLDLELRERGRDLFVAVGLAAEVTVSGTVRSANDRGYECLTLSDAVAPLSPSTGRHELHSITMSGGIFGAVGRSSDLLAAVRAAREPTAGTRRVPVPAPEHEE